MTEGLDLDTAKKAKLTRRDFTDYKIEGGTMQWTEWVASGGTGKKKRAPRKPRQPRMNHEEGLGGNAGLGTPPRN